MRVSAGEELEHCARETRLIEETYSVNIVEGTSSNLPLSFSGSKRFLAAIAP